MLSLQGYLAYWPVLVGSLVFFGLGLWLYWISEAAMERCPKPISWVMNYRRSDFPFSAQRLPWSKTHWLIPTLVALFAGLVAYGARFNAGKIILNRWISLTGSRYNLLLVLLCAGGAFAMYLLLQLLFQSRFSAWMGALLFAVSPIHGHATVCLLTDSALLLLLYLRSSKEGIVDELWYIGAGLLYALAIAASPQLVWLGPGYVILHWYKLSWRLRHSLLNAGHLVLRLVLALLCWLVFAVIAALLRRISLNYLRLPLLKELLTPIRIRYACSELLQAARESMFTPFMRNRFLELLLDAPLFGLGFWGCFSAGGMLLKRRKVQGAFTLGVTGALTLVWLLSGCYGLSLPLTLAVGSMLKNAELGEKRLPAGILCVLGILFSLALALAAWVLPLVSPLAWRLI